MDKTYSVKIQCPGDMGPRDIEIMLRDALGDFRLARGMVRHDTPLEWAARSYVDARYPTWALEHKLRKVDEVVKRLGWAKQIQIQLASDEPIQAEEG